VVALGVISLVRLDKPRTCLLALESPGFGGSSGHRQVFPNAAIDFPDVSTLTKNDAAEFWCKAQLP